METIDDETSAAAIDFMKRQHAAGKPFFCWFNATRMHLRTHVRAEHRGRYKHGDSEYIDGMIEHDETVGTLLKALDDMGIANDTIVVYTSDNGPHMNTWPDGAMTPFRSEKNTNWEGAFRVPCLVRWPGVIKPGTVTNELMSHNDWIPTLCAIAGEPDIVGKLPEGLHRPTASPTRSTSTATTSPTFLRTVERHRGEQQRREERPRQVLLHRRRRPARGHAAGRLQVRLRRAAPRRARWACGPSRSRSCACRRSSTCSRIRTSGRTSRPTPSGTGTSTTSEQVYGVMDEVFKFAATFKEFPPRSFPPSFNPATIMEETLDDIREAKKRAAETRK